MWRIYWIYDRLVPESMQQQRDRADGARQGKGASAPWIKNRLLQHWHSSHYNSRQPTGKPNMIDPKAPLRKRNKESRSRSAIHFAKRLLASANA